MALDFKYRIHEVAKDFGMTSKDISQILTDYATTPKNHMQVLEDAELDLIFEYLTQHHQVGSIAEIFAPEPEEKKAPAKAPEEKKSAEPAAEKVAAAGYRVSNIDVTMIAQRPKLKDFIPQMEANIALAVGIAASRVNVKATTEEKLGFTGTGEGMACHAVCLLEE